jgi:gliding motility-associated-like protein
MEKIWASAFLKKNSRGHFDSRYPLFDCLFYAKWGNRPPWPDTKDGSIFCIVHFRNLLPEYFPGFKTCAECLFKKTTEKIISISTEGRFDIPNAFTPNGDGVNDCFGVKHWGDATVFHFMIFNRWGEKVFETKNINNCWDGRYKGQPADIGNYVYHIKSVNFCREQVKKGNVILIR